MFDVAVIGGGIAGTATALALERSGASVVVVDRGGDRPLLAESLPRGAGSVLHSLGLWTDFLASRPQHLYGTRSTWGSAIARDVDFVFSPYGNGWRLDRPAFEGVLRDTVRRRGIPVLDRTRLASVDAGRESRWRLTVSRAGIERHFNADFLVDATGRSRQVSRMLGVPRLAYDRLAGHMGVLSRRESEAEDEGITEVEAVADGWWYASPLPDGRVVAGYMTDVDNPSAVQARRTEGWLSLIAQATRLRERAEGRTLVGPIRRVAADSSQPASPGGDGWCAVGDASGAHDPLSSRGILAALETARLAAAAIATSETGGLASYGDDMADRYTRYLAEWLGYYALETRWAGREFWWRRHQALHDLHPVL